MKHMKYVVSGFVLFFWIFFSGMAQAADKPLKSEEALVAATVNIVEPKILTQKKNIFTLSFDLMNRIGAQGGVQYAAVLLDTEKRIVHRHIFEPVLSLSSGETQHREIVYDIPESFIGEFVIAIETMNDAGLVYGLVPVNKVRLGSLDAPASSNATLPLSDSSSSDVTIMNTVFDKDGYQEGETAFFSYYFMGARDRVKSVTVQLVDGSGVSCSDQTESRLERPDFVSQVSATMSRECRNPRVTLSLKDSEGRVLSERSTEVETKQSLVSSQKIPDQLGNFSMKNILLLLFLVLPIGIAIIAVLWRKIRRGSVYHSISICIIIIFGSLLFTTETARADTVVVAGWPFQVSLDKSVYQLSRYIDPVWGDHSVGMEPLTTVSNYQGSTHVSSAICTNCIDVGITFPNGNYENTGPGTSFWDMAGRTSNALWGSSVFSHTPAVPGSYAITFFIWVDGQSKSYSIPYTVVPPSPINGVCGTANGGTYSGVPTSELCSDGSPTTPTGSGPWTWSCLGEFGGSTATCSANKTPVACVPSNSACADNICTTNTCFDGCSNIPGKINCPPACTPTNSVCADTTCTTDTCFDGCFSIPGNQVCSTPPSVDLKINGSDGPISLIKGKIKNITWTTSNVISCQALSSDGFTGSKSVPNGSESLPANVTSNHMLDCVDGSGTRVNDSVRVNVSCDPETGTYGACNCSTGTKTRENFNAACFPWTETEICSTEEINDCRDLNWQEVAP